MLYNFIRLSIFFNRDRLRLMKPGKKYGRYDDAILVRMEKALREEIERLSLEEDIPVSTMARRLIRQALAARKTDQGKAPPKPPRKK